MRAYCNDLAADSQQQQPTDRRRLFATGKLLCLPLGQEPAMLLT